MQSDSAVRKTNLKHERPTRGYGNQVILAIQLNGQTDQRRIFNSKPDKCPSQLIKYLEERYDSHVHNIEIFYILYNQTTGIA